MSGMHLRIRGRADRVPDLLRRPSPSAWFAVHPVHPARLEAGVHPQPDMIHDCLGHVPPLVNHDYAGLLTTIGRAAVRAASGDHVLALKRLSWFSIEFGLIEEAGGRASSARAFCRQPAKYRSRCRPTSSAGPSSPPKSSRPTTTGRRCRNGSLSSRRLGSSGAGLGIRGPAGHRRDVGGSARPIANALCFGYTEVLPGLHAGPLCAAPPLSKVFLMTVSRPVKSLLVAFVLLAAASVAAAQTAVQTPARKHGAAAVAPLPSATERVPVDPRITIGRLENGLRYYIRRNPRPAKTRRTAPGRQRRIGPRRRRPTRAGARGRAHGVQRHEAFRRPGHHGVHGVHRHAVRA